MKKILLINVVLANLCLSAMACELDGANHFLGGYAWPGVNINQAAISQADRAFHDESDRRQMDFRYSNTKSTASSEQKSKEKQEDKQK